MIKQFTYFLLDRDGKFYYVDSNGKVRTTATPTMLPHTPDGWREKKLSWGKSVSYLGLTRSFTVPLKFVLEGATILRYLRYMYGVNAYCRVVIHKLNKAFGAGMLHEDFYPGEVDFSKWNDSDETVTTELKDGGLANLVKANENTAYNIPFKDDADAITVKLDGIFLKERINFLVPPGLTVPEHIIGTYFINQEGNANGLAYFNTPTTSAASIDFATDTNYFLHATQAINNINLSGSLTFTLSFTSTPGVIYLKSNLGQSIVLSAYAAGTGLKQITINTTFNAAEDEKFFLYHDGVAISIFTYQETNISISFESRFKTTYAKAFFLKDAAPKLLNKVAGSVTPISTPVFDITGKQYAIVVTSGDAIRGFDSAKWRSSWLSFIKSINVPEPIGFGAEKINDIDTGVIDSPGYFFKSNVITNLGDVVDLSVTNADEWMCNTVKIGYPNQQYDEVNGRDEFNVTQVYTSPITKLVKEIDLVSEYRADPFGVEYTRINLEGKTSTDSDSDNETFLLLIDLTNQNADGSYNLYRGPFTALSGVQSPSTVYNVPLSPKTCLYKHGSRWRSAFYRYETEKLKFQTSDKNAELKYTLAGKTYVEKDDVVVGNFSQSPLWLPYIFQVQTIAPVNLHELMNDQTRYGVFQFNWKGKTLYGYVLEVSQQPADNEKQTWKLLCSSLTNINDLIYA